MFNLSKEIMEHKARNRLTDTVIKCKDCLFMSDDYFYFMKEALKEAEKGFDEGEVPVGAALFHSDGRIITTAHNRPIQLNDPTGHAEILAIRQGAQILKNYRLVGTTLVVTIEPCPMCVGAALNARISRLIFGADDPKSGAAGSLYNLASDKRLNHSMEIVSGIMVKECAAILRQFFRVRRDEAE